MGADPLSVVEAAYRFEASQEEWLRGIAQATYAQLGAGIGMLAFPYRVLDDSRVEATGKPCVIDMPEEFGTQSVAMVQSLPPNYVRRTFMRCEVTTQSQVTDPEVVAFNAPMRPMMEAMGWHDLVVCGGMDPSRHGLYLGAWLPKLTKLPPQVAAMWNRVAVHLTAATRLRHRLGIDGPGAPDAVLAPDGKLLHAEGEAADREARSALFTAVREVERARTKLRRHHPEQAVDEWKGLVSARWTLLDQFESDGKRYVVARRNDVEPGGAEALTARERQALGYAALGHGNKLIAYEMGVSASTVGVLLHRAARKLGARTRAELVEKFGAI
jgi:DNA-binding CsgD family transcriptional regulator